MKKSLISSCSVLFTVLAMSSITLSNAYASEDEKPSVKTFFADACECNRPNTSAQIAYNELVQEAESQGYTCPKFEDGEVRVVWTSCFFCFDFVSGPSGATVAARCKAQ